jgi:SAM-dependent methyltransferase
MFIERLALGPDSNYSPTESSIHLGRYLLAKQFCEGKKVLDIACGEGYGAHAMASLWGAQFVVGVDVSDEAINNAKSLFQTSSVEFTCADAQGDPTLFEPMSFDLIVSFETIEHLENPVGYLENLKRWLKEDGVILISCPNDNWYYKNAEQSNPYHQRKYSFTEFRQLTETVLGEARSFLYGFPIHGFSSVHVDSTLFEHKERNMEAMFDYKSPTSIMLPSIDQIDESNVSYFIGMWGRQESTIAAAACFYGTNMDNYIGVPRAEVVLLEKEKVEILRNFDELRDQLKHTQGLEDQINSLKDELGRLIIESKEIKGDLEQQVRQNQKLLLSVNGMLIENEYLKENLARASTVSTSDVELQKRKIEELEDFLNSILQSKSWKITDPLRKLFQLFKR